MKCANVMPPRRQTVLDLSPWNNLRTPDNFLQEVANGLNTHIFTRRSACDPPPRHMFHSPDACVASTPAHLNSCLIGFPIARSTLPHLKQTQDPGSEDSISLSSHLREGSSPEASFSAMRFTSEDPEDTPPSTSEGIDDGDNCNGFSSDIACGKASTLREFAGNGNANQEEDCGAPPATAKRAHRSSRDARGAAGDRCTTVRQRTQHDKRKSLAGR